MAPTPFKRKRQRQFDLEIFSKRKRTIPVAMWKRKDEVPVRSQTHTLWDYQRGKVFYRMASWGNFFSTDTYDLQLFPGYRSSRTSGFWVPVSARNYKRVYSTFQSRSVLGYAPTNGVEISINGFDLCWVYKKLSTSKFVYTIVGILIYDESLIYLVGWLNILYLLKIYIK